MTDNIMKAAEKRRQLRDRFRGVLLEAAKQRGQRDRIIQTPDGPEWEWIRYEREQLLASVNAERARRGLDPADVEDIRSAELQASGHYDYANKIALYCAEIALGIGRTMY